jgi:hypothetical protein
MSTMTPPSKRKVEAAVRAKFDEWLRKYYIAEQHPLTVEALWAAWQEGARLAATKGRK